MRFLFLIVVLFAVNNSSQAQLSRELANPDPRVDDIFKAPKVIGLNSVKQIGKHQLQMSILHTFGGEVSGGVKTFWGLDNGANVRLGLDYGITDDLSVGIGRTSYFKVVDTRVKWTPIHQTTKKVPVSVAFLGSVSIETIPNRFITQPLLSDKIGFLGMAMVARKFSDQLSLQVSPMVSHFQRVPDDYKKTLIGLGWAGRYKLADRTAITFEAVPILNKPNYLSTPIAIGIDIETGGHVFQMFFSSSSYHTEHYIIANNTMPFIDDKARFKVGFNVNRVFGL